LKHERRPAAQARTAEVIKAKPSMSDSARTLAGATVSLRRASHGARKLSRNSYGKYAGVHFLTGSV
jgi:hypothetical protein